MRSTTPISPSIGMRSKRAVQGGGPVPLCGTHDHAGDAERAVCLSGGGLSAVPPAGAVSPCGGRWPHLDRLSLSAVRGPRTGTPTANNGGTQNAVRRTGGDCRDDVPRRAGHGRAARPLYGVSADAPPACRHGRGDQCRAHRRLADGGTTRTNPPITLVCRGSLTWRLHQQDQKDTLSTTGRGVPPPLGHARRAGGQGRGRDCPTAGGREGRGGRHVRSTSATYCI